MLRVTFLLLGICVLGMIGRCSASGYELANGYWSLHGQDGWFDALKFDPAGQGRYSGNLITSLSMGPAPDSMPGMKAKQSGDTLKLSGLRVKMPFETENMPSSHPFELKPGQTLGMKLTLASGKLTSVGGKFPTWASSTSGCTLSLYLLPDGDLSKRQLMVSKKITNVADNSVRSIEFDPQPSGVYYVEMSEPVGGTIGWWGTDQDVDASTSAYLDGKEDTKTDLALVYGGFNELAGDWTIRLDGKNLYSTFTPADPSAESAKTSFVRIVTPWEKNGYDVSKFPFSRFYTDTGRHMLVQQLKRRPFSDQLQAGKWVYAMGKKDSDIRFNLADGQRLTWVFEDKAMIWKFNGSSLNMDVLPHNAKLPNYYPVFYSSDKKYDKILNEFYYSHAFNFGVGTPPDWKEWQALILDWTANPQRDEQKSHFTGVQMRADGYVSTWGAQEGWPFPFKDEDKDGKNDYDTRHFTTNPCFILGAYRYFCWTRDMSFLKEIMPKVRKAMAFELNDMHGRDGIIVIDAKGHEGRADGIGSNYWDILPFGYKDAFCNSYYYEALRAMADLEWFCANAGVEVDGPKETPLFYEDLRIRTRKSYNKNFWNDAKGRYVGCVDVDGVKHDYGFTFVNIEAMAYGLADKPQVERVYRWMETEKTSSGAADTYSKWIFAPRALTIHNPPRAEVVNSQQSTVTSEPSAIIHQPSDESPSSPQSEESPSGPQSAIRNPQSEMGSWWHFGWGGTPYDDQCQTGGGILYNSGYDVIARARYVSADNAYKRLREILDRYNMPDRLCGGSPLYRGETTQGGPGGGAGSAGVEGEFPESGLAPASFLYAFLGIDADARGLKIRPNLPSTLKYAGVRNLCYAGMKYDIKVTNDSVEITPLDVAKPVTIKHKLVPGEPFVLSAGISQ